jgi:hypothetical protein
VEQTKLPELYGNRIKDSITANFIKRIHNMMKANNWTFKVAFSNFAQANSYQQSYLVKTVNFIIIKALLAICLEIVGLHGILNGATTLSTTTLGIKTLSIMGLFSTLSINDI